jgi:hypothetical protein
VGWTRYRSPFMWALDFIGGIELDLFSVIGATIGVLGCAMGGFRLYLHWRSNHLDQASLKISAVMGLSKNSENPDAHPYLKITLRNAGRRLVYVHDIWVQVPGTEEILKNTSEQSIEITEERINLSHSISDMPILLEEHGMREINFDPFSNTIATHLGVEQVSLKVEDSLGGIHETSFIPCHVSENRQN